MRVQIDEALQDSLAELGYPKDLSKYEVINFPVWPRNRLISAGLEPVLNKLKIYVQTIFHEY